MHAFPSNQDVDNLWTFSKKTSRKILLLITLPFLLIIKLANLLRFIWFDLIFAIALFLIATNGIGFALISFSTGGGIDNINNSKAYIACNNIENESFCNEKSYEWCVNGTGYETACSKFKVCLEEQKDYTDCFDKFFYKTHKSD